MLLNSTAEKNTLEQIWSLYQKDPSVYEMEFRLTNSINRNQFTNLLSRLQALPQYSEMQVDEYMTVSYRENGKQLHVRHTIPNDELMNYCNRIFSYNTYETDFKYPVYINGQSQHIQLQEYPIRCNLKYEIPWSRASNQFAITNTIDPDTTRTIEKEAKQSYDDKMKKYRNIKRFSFQTSDGYFRIDCSMLKTNTQPVHHITSSDLHTVPAQFEVEIECLDNSTELSFSDVAENVTKHLHVVVQSLQNSLYVIPGSELEQVKLEYEEWINQQRQALIQKHKIQTRYETISGDKLFVSPKPVSISRRHLRPKNKINIVNNYTVTDKADGESALLYVAQSGKIYVINHKLEFQDTGIKNTSYSGSLFNGELVTKTKDGLTCYDYMAYDAYIVQNVSCMDEPLMSLDETVTTRLGHLNSFIESNQFTYKSDSKVGHPCRLLAKSFYHTRPDKTIFELAKGIWGRRDTFRYKLDGLIFTPADKPVAYNDTKADYLANINQTWAHNIKWKPSEENTIDFLVSIEPEVKHDANGERYRNVQLFVGDRKDKVYGKSQFSWKVNGNTMRTTRWRVHSDSYSVILSHDGDEVITDTVVECMYDFNEPVGYRWKPLRTRHDKTYTYNKDTHTQQIQYEVFQRLLQGKSCPEDNRTLPKLRRQFVTVGLMKRHQKMTRDVAQSLQSHIKSAEDIPHNINSGNNARVARDIWNLIQNPVSVADITGEKYYTSTAKTVDDSMYRKYHNQIKFSLYQITNKRKAPKLLLDIGCGQGGDISKWRRNKFGLVVGVDKVSENIQRAQKRLDKIKSLDREKIHLFAADMSQPVDKTMNNDDISRFRNLLSRQKEDVLFDVVSCQFAIHYFCQSRDTWAGFMRNIHTYLKPEGFFIGTCMNGVRVDSMFRQNGLSEITGPFGRIRKKYKTNTFGYLKVPLGQKIETFIESIGTSNDEYLVDVNWIIQQMKLYNIEVYHPKKHPFFEFGNASFGDIYDDMKRKVSSIDVPKNQQEFSFLNHYFIFKRGKKETEFDHAVDLWNSFEDVKTDSVTDIVDTFYTNGYVIDEDFGQAFYDMMEVEEESETQTQSSEEPKTISLSLRSVHAYKLSELQTIAKEHNISIKKQGKKKMIQRTKTELYEELKKLG
jgi:SAM-dependent methyltransferase